jgi:N,N'-diacetyllegionaminate synthase
MSFSEWRNILTICKKNKIKFYFDIFGKKSLLIAQKLKVNGIKIHPTDLDNFKLLKQVKLSKIKKIYLGIGGASFTEINKALKILKNKTLVLLLGFQSYPTPNSFNQISRIKHLSILFKKKFKKNKIRFGFADHSTNIDASIPCISAIGAGADVIEKHITIKSKKPLEDSESAILGKDFFILKNKLLLAWNATNFLKIKKKFFGMSNIEKKYKMSVRRIFVSAKKINKGYAFKSDVDLELKRSSLKNIIYNFKQIKNKKLKNNISINVPITKKILK